MNATGIEKKDAFYCLDSSAVGVAIDDRVRVREPVLQSTRKAAMWPEVAEAQGPHQGVGLLEPVTSVAMHDHDHLPSHDDLARSRQRWQRPVMVAPNRLDRCQAAQLGERLLTVNVTCMKDQIDSGENVEDPSRQPIEELRTVRIGDDADARLQTS